MSSPQSPPERVYLDNAATTWPKAPAILAATEDFIKNCGATAGRGTYSSAQIAESWLARGRKAIASLVGATRPQDIAFCSSGTHALNAALQILHAGDHVVTSNNEHNSLLRPLSLLQSRGIITFETMDAPEHWQPNTDSPTPRLIAVGHASNVTGDLSCLRTWKQFAQDCNATLMVDASQTLGYVPIDMQSSGIDLLAAAGHKGLGGLQGTGLLAASPAMQGLLQPLMTGGTGRSSESIAPDSSWPQTVEVGNLNMPGVVSMAVAAEKLLQKDRPLSAEWWPPFERLVDGLRQIDGIQLLGQHPALHRVPSGQANDQVANKENETTNSSPHHVPNVPVVSLLVEGWDVHDLATILDTSFGIETRAGFHCAALIHQQLDSAQGTLRLSTSRSTSLADIEHTLSALRQILHGTN